MNQNYIERAPWVDRSKWEPGPWDNEPDKIVGTDDATGLPMMIIRNTIGALCGYVGVNEGHSLFGKSYMDLDLQVHGGLTFANKCSGHICHVPEAGQPDHVWWLGFDCAHAFDQAPGMRFAIDDEYRDIEYVKAECAKLAQQLHDYDKPKDQEALQPTRTP